MSGSRSRRIGRLAVQALVTEASLAPKPGLVTPSSSGAHRDMDYPLFLASAQALEPCFTACAHAGEVAGGTGTSLKVLLGTLRSIGQEGEGAMFQATGGINTHKGAVFCLGLLSAAVAFVQAQGLKQERLGDAACEVVAGLCSGLVERELARTKAAAHLTAGERLFQAQGVRGARGQAEDGYPLLWERLLPLLRAAYPRGREPFRVACLDALLLSMAELEDSCLLARGGAAGLEIARRGAGEILRLGGASSEQGLPALNALDCVLTQARLSPGGSADMVAAAIFLVRTEYCLGVAAARSERHIA